jgi:hypothetical protein
LQRPAKGLALIALHPLGVTHAGEPHAHVALHVSCCTSPTLGHEPLTVIVSPGEHGPSPPHAPNAPHVPPVHVRVMVPHFVPHGSVSTAPASHSPASTIVSAESVESVDDESFVSRWESIVESIVESIAESLASFVSLASVVS